MVGHFDLRIRPGRSYHYTTTPEGLVTQIGEEPSGQVWTYGYDAANRLVSAHSSALGSYAYTPDTVGNITQYQTPNGTAAATYNNDPLKMARAAGRAAGLRTPEEFRAFHDAITGQGITSYKELYDIAVQIKLGNY